MAHEVSASSTSTPVPGQRAGKPEPPRARPEDAVPGDGAAGGGLARPVPFDRLLTVAVLTPAQATLIAADLLNAAAATRGDEDRGDPSEDLRGVRIGPVRMGTGGEVEIGDPPGPGAGREVNDLLQELLLNARRLPSHPRPDQVTLLRRLEEVAGDPLLDPAARAHALEQALVATLGPVARTRVTGELSVLVSAFAHVAPGVPDAHRPGDAPLPLARPTSTSRVHGRAPAKAAERGSGSRAPRAGGPPPGHAPVRLRRRHNIGRRHRRLRSRRALTLGLVVVLLLAGGGYFVLKGPGSGLVESLGGGQQPSDAGAAPATHGTHASHGTKTKSAAHRQRTVPRVAKPSAGRINQVVVRRTGACRPGSTCPVSVTVHLDPRSSAQAVAWKVGAARICRQRIVWSPGRTVTAQAGWTRVFASSSVRVPRGRSLALVAVSTAPAHAQSRPVPLTGSLHC